MYTCFKCPWWVVSMMRGWMHNLFNFRRNSIFRQCDPCTLLRQCTWAQSITKRNKVVFSGYQFLAVWGMSIGKHSQHVSISASSTDEKLVKRVQTPNNFICGFRGDKRPLYKLVSQAYLLQSSSLSPSFRWPAVLDDLARPCRHLTINSWGFERKINGQVLGVVLRQGEESAVLDRQPVQGDCSDCNQMVVW